MTVVENLKIRIDRLSNEYDKKGLNAWLIDYKQTLEYGNKKLASQLFSMIYSQLSISERKENKSHDKHR